MNISIGAIGSWTSGPGVSFAFDRSRVARSIRARAEMIRRSGRDPDQLHVSDELYRELMAYYLGRDQIESVALPNVIEGMELVVEHGWPGRLWAIGYR